MSASACNARFDLGSVSRSCAAHRLRLRLVISQRLGGVEHKPSLNESQPPDLGGVTLLQGAGCNVIAIPGNTAH
jgi:hypothetical protein